MNTINNKSNFGASPTGFRLTLDNGFTVSVQFGSLHFCSNKNRTDIDLRNVKSPDAEVAVWDSDGKFVTLNKCQTAIDTGKCDCVIHDDVLGHQSVSQVIDIINKFNTIND